MILRHFFLILYPHLENSLTCITITEHVETSQVQVENTATYEPEIADDIEAEDENIPKEPDVVAPFAEQEVTETAIEGVITDKKPETVRTKAADTKVVGLEIVETGVEDNLEAVAEAKFAQGVPSIESDEKDSVKSSGDEESIKHVDEPEIPDDIEAEDENNPKEPDVVAPFAEQKVTEIAVEEVITDKKPEIAITKAEDTGVVKLEVAETDVEDNLEAVVEAKVAQGVPAIEVDEKNSVKSSGDEESTKHVDEPEITDDIEAEDENNPKEPDVVAPFVEQEVTETVVEEVITDKKPEIVLTKAVDLGVVKLEVAETDVEDNLEAVDEAKTAQGVPAIEADEKKSFKSSGDEESIKHVDEPEIMITKAADTGVVKLEVVETDVEDNLEAVVEAKVAQDVPFIEADEKNYVKSSGDEESIKHVEGEQKKSTQGQISK